MRFASLIAVVALIGSTGVVQADQVSANGSYQTGFEIPVPPAPAAPPVSLTYDSAANGSLARMPPPSCAASKPRARSRRTAGMLRWAETYGDDWAVGGEPKGVECGDRQMPSASDVPAAYAAAVRTSSNGRVRQAQSVSEVRARKSRAPARPPSNWCREGVSCPVAPKAGSLTRVHPEQRQRALRESIRGGRPVQFTFRPATTCLGGEV
jgi:hypothetical protein